MSTNRLYALHNFEIWEGKDDGEDGETFFTIVHRMAENERAYPILIYSTLPEAAETVAVLHVLSEVVHTRVVEIRAERGLSSDTSAFDGWAQGDDGKSEG